MILILCLGLLLLTSAMPIFFNKKDKLLITGTQCVMVFLFFIVAAYSFYQQKVVYYSWNFLDFNHINLTLLVQFDMLAKIMMLFILIIGFFIYCYAKNYLESDKTRVRFLSQFNLVLSSVLLLVMSANLLTAFVAWQLIGINLYLLLNHYHSDPAANRAAKKKFVINRIGDCCFLLAIVLAYHTSSASSFVAIKSSPHTEFICGLLFISVMTKCAQFPLHIWLMDTMETPTPVSALMHAGIINAGGILLTRMSVSLASFHAINYLILCVGLISLVLSAQWINQQADTKKKLAYSTMGQMGYMLTQCSLGAFPAAIFHLISHGFYKASLFLNAGETLIDVKKNSNQSISYSLILKSLFIASIIFFLGFLFFKNQPGHMPLLMYGFIFFTLLTLTLKINLSILPRWPTCIFYYFLITLLFFAYFCCFGLFSRLLSEYEYFGGITLPIQAFILIVLLLSQIYLWRKQKAIPSIVVKDNTEFFLRRFFLRPLRAAGNVVNVRSCRKLILLVYMVAIIVIAFGFFFGLLSHHIIVNHVAISYGFIFASLMIGIIGLIAANRCLSIQSLIVYLILFELAFTNIAWFHANTNMMKIGFFHLINIATVILMLVLLARDNKSCVIVKSKINRLPARIFYLTFCLLLLIGIPGTASFISEFYLLSVLINTNLIFVLMYMSLIILLAIVVMHSLQLYVFSSEHTKLLLSPINKKNHLIFLLIIGFNIVCGIYPSFLLGHL